MRPPPQKKTQQQHETHSYTIKQQNVKINKRKHLLQNFVFIENTK